MNDKERFALADRIQKRIQEQHPHFRLIRRRDEIEKEIKGDEDQKSPIKSSAPSC
jgi:hypothetical protein